MDSNIRRVGTGLTLAAMLTGTAFAQGDVPPWCVRQEYMPGFGFQEYIDYACVDQAIEEARRRAYRDPYAPVPDMRGYRDEYERNYNTIIENIGAPPPPPPSYPPSGGYGYDQGYPDTNEFGLSNTPPPTMGSEPTFGNCMAAPWLSGCENFRSGMSNPDTSGMRMESAPRGGWPTR